MDGNSEGAWMGEEGEVSHGVRRKFGSEKVYKKASIIVQVWILGFIDNCMTKMCLA